jgi:hypothetical protein
MQKIRNLTHTDKSRILEISAKVWDGEDYLSEVVDKWLTDKTNIFVGLFVDGLLIGFGRMTFITPTDVWLEGLRKDLDSTEKGVGEKLLRYMLKLLSKRSDIISIRFSTYIDNIESITFNEKMGFEIHLTYSNKVLNLIGKRKRKLSGKIAVQEDTMEAKEFVRKSDYLKKMKNNFAKGWVVHPYSEVFIDEFAQSTIVYKEDEDIKGCAIYYPGAYEGVLWICFIQAETQNIYKALNDYIVNIALKNNYSSIEVLVPQKSKLMSFVRKAGYESWEKDNDFLLYEFPIEKLKEFSDNIY